MDVTTTPSITSLANKLRPAYPAYSFETGPEFRWAPDVTTIFFDASSSDLASLLHELSHAELKHNGYRRDVELIAMERDAWQYAYANLAPLYNIVIEEDQIEDALDTYRNWLHARSTCPNCQTTGVQSKEHEYRCVACFATWRVNDARSCALRRWKKLKERSA